MNSDTAERHNNTNEGLPQFGCGWLLLGITALPDRAFLRSGMNWVLLNTTALPKKAFPNLGVDWVLLGITALPGTKRA